MNEVSPALVLATARAWLGTPWARRAALRGGGADCVGLVRGVLADVSGVMVPAPPWRADWRDAAASPIITAAAAHLSPCGRSVAPGRVVAFRMGPDRITHVGISDRDGGLIHAVEGVGVVRITSAPWPVSSVWSFPLAEDCEPGDPSLDPAGLLAVVRPSYAASGAWVYAIQDADDATPLGVSRPYASAAEALAHVPPEVGHIERV